MQETGARVSKMFICLLWMVIIDCYFSMSKCAVSCNPSRDYFAMQNVNLKCIRLICSTRACMPNSSKNWIELDFIVTICRTELLQHYFNWVIKSPLQLSFAVCCYRKFTLDTKSTLTLYLIEGDYKKVLGSTQFW